MNAGDIFAFRRLASSDMAMLHDWLHRPHVAQWWHDAGETLADVEEDFRERTLPESTTKGYIALLNGEPIGFIQSYVAFGSGGGWWEGETDPGVRGIDQFLANADQLGQGLGSAMIRAFVAQLFADPSVTKVQTDPRPDNPRAIRCYRRAGFSELGEIVTPDGPALLMVMHRPEVRTPRQPPTGQR